MQNTHCVVFIYLDSKPIAVPAGTLDFQDGKYIFQYGKQYLKRKNALPVDPLKLPLRKGQILLEEDNLGLIRDSAPDYWGRLVFQKLSSIFDPGEIDYLLAPNAVRIGNLDFRKSAEEPEPLLSVPEFAELPEILEVAEAIEKDKKLDKNQEKVAVLLRFGSSLGGARPKCTVRIGDELWLTKFPAKGDKHSNARIEAATMRLAQQAGVSIPDLKVESIAGRDVLLIRRFDRTGIFDRHPYMSALSMLGITERDFNQFSYPNLAGKIRQYGHTADLLELFKRISVNIIVRNTDDHPRNHGFLFDGHNWRLTPAFDITPTASTPGVTSIAHLAMSPGLLGKEATFSNLSTRIGEFGLKEEEGKAIFDKIAETITKNWQKVFSEFGVSHEDVRLFANTFSLFKDEDVQKEQGDRRPTA